MSTGLLIFMRKLDTSMNAIELPYNATVSDLCNKAGVDSVSYQGCECLKYETLADLGICQETVVDEVRESSWDITLSYKSRTENTFRVSEETTVGSLLNDISDWLKQDYVYMLYDNSDDYIDDKDRLDKHRDIRIISLYNKDPDADAVYGSF